MGRKLVGNSGNDRIYTPEALALAIVKHFHPSSAFEPCKGDGAFCKAFEQCGVDYDYSEIDEGKDFFDVKEVKQDWVITNPPFSLIAKFLEKCYRLDVNNIVFLCTINAFWMNGKLETMKKYGYSIKEIQIVESPYFRRLNNWPQSGFSLGATLISKGGNSGIIKVDENKITW